MTHEPSMKRDAGQEAFQGTEYRRLGYSLFVAFSDDRLECRCSYAPRSTGAMMTRAELCAFLEQANVRTGIDGDELERFAVGAAAGHEMRDALIASGTPPVNGADGAFLPLARASIVAHHEDEEGDVHDFRKVQTFVNVGPGDEIGRIIPHERGVPGRRVTGEVIVPRHGRPLKCRIGKNIRTEDNGMLLVAEAGGRVCHAHGEISVEQEYRVSGDVDFAVGSIDFNGVVDIQGDVLDGFTVTASKGLRVGGNIGNCGIAVGGDVVFCGMDGQNRGAIISGGSVRAQFIHNCRIECTGDVIVEREILNSTVLTLGRIIVGRGIIVGGSHSALGGIEAHRVGSRASMFTQLSIGVDYRDVLRLEQLHAELAHNHQRLAEAEGMNEVEALRFERSVLADRIMELRAKAAATGNPKLNIRSVLCENVLVTIGAWSHKFREEQEGPVSIIENSIDGGLWFIPLTGLEIRAADLEQAFIRESRQ